MLSVQFRPGSPSLPSRKAIAQGAKVLLSRGPGVESLRARHSRWVQHGHVGNKTYRLRRSQLHIVLSRYGIGVMTYDQGRAIPSFFMRKYSVDRFIPRSVAAPLGPERTHLVSFKVARMCSRSTSAKVRSFSLSHSGVMRD